MSKESFQVQALRLSSSPRVLAGGISFVGLVIQNSHPLVVRTTARSRGRALSFESKQTHRFHRSCAPRRDVGDATQAEALATKLDRLFPEDTFQQNVILPVIRSVSERQRGNALKAVDLLAPVTRYPNVLVFYHRGQAYMAAGEQAKAAADFEKLIGRRGLPGWELFAPLAQLGRARAYAMQGDREESRKAYDDFFTTWKDADPDIPILRQAKAEYKKLTAKPPAS